MVLINESGEELKDEELLSFAQTIRKLPPEKIDELWFLCGFIYTHHDPTLKALRKEDILEIQKGIEQAKEVVYNLLFETPIEKFKENLKKVL